jgi:hypothetical protein
MPKAFDSDLVVLVPDSARRHTPGPWDYVTATTSMKHAHPGWTVRTKIGVEPRKNIARVGTTLNIEAGQANAALIAAAPEMLEALKKVHAVLRCIGTDENNDTCGVTYTCPNCMAATVSRAAIAKAEGRA